MTAPQRKRRPTVRAVEPAGQKDAEPEDNSPAAFKARNKKPDPFTIFKWAWLDQVAADASLPPAAYRIAILIAGRHLNRKTGEAWPGVEKLARALSIKSANTVRTAIKAMEAGGHMAVRWSAGGQKQTNHFLPLVEGKPFKNLKGMENGNPSNFDADTLQNHDAKPFKDLKGNPMSEPYDEPRRARSAPADGDHRDHIGDARLKGASPVKFKIGQHIDIDGLGDCVIGNAGRGAQRGWLYLHVTPPDCWDYGTIVPIDPDGGFRPDLAWAKASEPSKERDIEWEVVDE